ncbi:MAG: hypothetical protein RSG07_05135 [Erysipelotrichaceae bacterium]
MKTKIIAEIGIVVLAIALIIGLKPKSFDKQLSKAMKGMSSYTLEGEMELIKGEDTKSYIIQVSYLDDKDKDNYKVSLFDKNLNQEQVILANKSGVYVVTPSLNQIFKFEGDWPMNSPKPYLLQTMLDVVENDKAVIKKESDGYLVSSEVSYANNKSYTRQEMLFDKDTKIKWVQIYNKDNVAELKLVFNKVEYNNELKEEFFKEPSNLEKSESKETISKEDLPMYPVEVFNAQLSNASVVDNEDGVKHILDFKGDKSFTVIEKIKEVSKETQSVVMGGVLVDSMDVIGVYDGNSMSAINNNLEISVFSDELDPQEMLSVIQSMQVSVMK